MVHDCKRRIIDTIGCAIAAFDEEPPRIARAVAMRAQVSNGASVIGAPQRTLPELAAFANSVASRLPRRQRFNKRYPRSLPCRMTITLKSGEQKTAEISNPVGHHDRPMSDAQLADKFRGLAGRKLSSKRMEKILDRVWKFENDGDWASLFDELRI